MKKTLYITDHKNYEIILDGPSLWIKKANTAGYRIPLRILDYVYINHDVSINYEILMALFSMKIPVAFCKNKTNVVVHITPYFDSGYFYDINQRVASKNETIKNKFSLYMATEKRQNQVSALKHISINLGKAYEDHYIKEDEYNYEILKHCNCHRSRFFNVKKILRSWARELIIKKCIDYNLDPHIGILNTKDAMGLAKDVSIIIDPLLDAIVVDFFKIKQKNFWKNEHILNDAGVKMLVIIYEKIKEQIDEKIDRVLNKILEILQ